MTYRFVTTHGDGNPLVAALRRSGARVDGISPSAIGTCHDLDGCHGFFGNLFDDIKFSLGFLALKRRLKARRIPYIHWNCDAPWHVGLKTYRRWLIQCTRPVDIYLAHSLQDARIFSRNCHYFPNAARPPYFADTDLASLNNEAAYHHDVSFFGAISNTKRRGCRERLAFFQALEQRLTSKRPSIRFQLVDTVSQALPQAEQLALIRHSKINLNFGAMCDLPGNPSWGMPERVFGIPAAGGFLLTDFREAIPQTFANDACDAFHGVDDCVEKILYYLDHFPLLRQRADEMHRQVLAQHTYERRAEQLCELIREWQP